MSTLLAIAATAIIAILARGRHRRHTEVWSVQLRSGRTIAVCWCGERFDR